LKIFTKSKIEKTLSEKRNIILHFHIFKNAGSTIEWILEKNFPKKNLLVDGKTPGSKIYLDKIIDYLRKNPSIKTLSSHQIRFPISNKIEFNFISILFIRHPMDRAFSIYYFKRKEKDNSIGTKKASSLNLTEFVKWNLDLKIYKVMKNFQVIFLSDKDTKLDTNKKDLDVAIKRMQRCPIIGVVNKMDESLVLAEEVLRVHFPDIDLSYIKQNVSTERKNNLEERLSVERKNIGIELFERLENNNSLDIELYNETNKEMNNRIKNIYNFENKLKLFQEKCKKLSDTK
jgi:hypothetical protein